jgi:hypothetical protein
LEVDDVVEKITETPKLTSDANFTSRPKPASDPAFWIEVNAYLRSYFSDITPSQNIDDSDSSTSGRKFGEKERYVNKGWFCKHLGDGETVQSDWIIYSPSTGQVYCYAAGYKENRARKRKQFTDGTGTDFSVDIPSDRFHIKCFYRIMDQLIVEMEKR